MIRQKIFEFVADKRWRQELKVILIVVFIGTIFVISNIPYLTDQYYIEENALDAKREYEFEMANDTMRFLFENFKDYSDIRPSSRIYKV